MKKTRLAFIFLLFPFFTSGQLTEDFSDGDFTANPAWSGDAGLWQVTAGQLNSNSFVASSEFYLSTPFVSSPGTEWRIYLNLKFATSGANYADIHLVSDTSVLAAPGNGYFVRVGGTDDEISLFRKDGGTPVKIIDGTDDRAEVNSVNNMIHLKIIRSASNDWTLSDDNTGTGLSFFTEGSINDATYPSGSYFGISVTQSTASFFNKHFFDDVYAGPIQVDSVAPVVSGVTVISSTQADVMFSEALDPATSQVTGNYSVNNGIGTPSTAVLDSTNPALVHLSFPVAFASGISNTLTVINVEDLSSNAIISSAGNFTYIAPVTAAFRDVIITEIFPDPDPVVGLPGKEFTEIFNNSNKTFDLAGWKLTDGSSTATLPPTLLLPGSYLILCAVADTGLFSPFGAVTGLSSFPSLNNDGDPLQLNDNNLFLVDSVTYSDEWYHDSGKKSGGWSLELINPQAPGGCSDSVNWTASVNSAGGTPGQQNSVYSLDPDVQQPLAVSASVTDSLHVKVCFNEGLLAAVLANPSNYTINPGIGTAVSAISSTGNTCVELTMASPLEGGATYTISFSNLTDCSGNAVQQATFDFTYYVAFPADSGDVILNEILFNPHSGGYDYVEIYNRSQKVIDMQSLRIAGSDILSAVALVDSRELLLPGSYAVFTENPVDLGFRYTIKNDSSVYGIDDLPSYNDDEGDVALTNQAFEIIDAFHYSEDYHFPLLKEVDGVSLERLSSSRPTPDPTNWHSAAQTAGFGTPGYKNSENTDGTNDGSELTVSPEIFSPDADGYNDLVSIRFHFNTPGYVANVNIYDSRGRIVRNLVRNQLLANEGQFDWDGITEEREKAPIGIYIIYIEVFNKDGDVKKFKRTCVLGGRI